MRLRNGGTRIVRAFWACLAAMLAACSGPAGADVVDVPNDAPVTDAASDRAGDVSADTVEASVMCASDNDCSDRVFCNGAERCAPGTSGADARGCVAATPANPCSTNETCDEAMGRCVSNCAAADADGDGHRSAACGGDDCDDNDPNRFPGHAEVCDAMNHDEDCDANTFGVRDNDGDGEPDAHCCNVDSGGTQHCGTDCDDIRASVHPSAMEACNGRDDDCDGMIDEGVETLYHRDADGDGYGDPAGMTMSACAMPAGYVVDTTDCDDARNVVNPGNSEACDGLDNNCNGMTDEGVLRTFHRDADGDGYGSASGAVMMACNPPSGFVENATDCDDTASMVNPAASEQCDMLDNNCNGMIDEAGSRTFYRDADGDGFGDPLVTEMTMACTPSAGFVAMPGDCNDTRNDVHPGATELCNRLDDDCSLGASAAGIDTAEDADNDGHAPLTAACMGSNRDDCLDTDPNVYPGAPEICDRLVDDCRATGGGTANAAEDNDRDGHASTTATCVGGYPHDDCNETNAAVYPGAPELCDRIDNQCRGAAAMPMLEDVDGDGHAAPTAMCMGGYPKDDCNDAVATTYGGAPEVCNRIDDNCSVTASPGGVEVAEDVDDDGFAPTTATCTGGSLPRTDCNDTRPEAHPGAREVCDGIDDDCDAMIDEAPEAPSSCASTQVCSSGRCEGIERLTNGEIQLCTLRAGTVYCWYTSFAASAVAPEITDAVEVTAGHSHACLRRATGDVLCWGSNTFGQLGDGTTVGHSDPAAVAGLTDAVEISAGSDHTCARRATGAIVCWGKNDAGQLGDGTRIDRRTPVTVSGLAAVAEIDAGGYNTCARSLDGTVRCWGDNGYGQIGDGSSVGHTTPSLVSGLTDAAEITVARFNFACARRASGSVVCWGSNLSSQLGSGTTVPTSNTPVPVAGITDAVQVVASGVHACVRRVGGSIACWGGNADAALGDGTFTDRPTPVPAAGAITDALEIAAGAHSTCVRRADGSVVCFGTIGATGESSNVPVPVLGIGDATAVDAGFGHVCATRASGISCWGSNSYGQIGDGTFGASRLIPVNTVPAVSGYNAISAGGFDFTAEGHTCIVDAANALECWGSNGSFQTGSTAGTVSSPTVIASTAASAATRVAAGGAHTCLLTASSPRVICFGRNSNGQLGDGSTTTRSFATATAVAGFTSPIAIAAGPLHSCAVESSGTVSCWGDNGSGQLGAGSTGGTRTTPIAVSGLSDAIAIDAGGYASTASSTCALRSGGGVSCWGSDSSGQLGDGGGRVDSNVPVSVSGLANVTAIAVGANHACALHTAGTVSCWGDCFQGECGDGGLAGSRDTPVPVSGLADATAITAGAGYSCALRSTGGIVCWGTGPLGDGRETMARAVTGLP